MKVGVLPEQDEIRAAFSCAAKHLRDRESVAALFRPERAPLDDGGQLDGGDPYMSVTGSHESYLLEMR
jgi:hypothetical protein